MKENYQIRYNRMATFFYHHPKALKLLRLSNDVVVWTMYAAYFVILLWLGFNVPTRLWQFILIPGICFIILSVIRQVVNEPRPYEQWAITPLIVRKKKGDSMPSRHVFSASLIAMCGWRLNLILGVVLMIFAVISAITRVIGGVHFPKDVLVGMLAGIVSGLLLFLV